MLLLLLIKSNKINQFNNEDKAKPMDYDKVVLLHKYTENKIN